MSRLSMVYDGKQADELTRDELLDAIFEHFKVNTEYCGIKCDTPQYAAIILLMNEAFRCGFLRGEEYGMEVK